MRDTRDTIAGLVLIAAIALAFVVTSRWDAEADASYARFATCQASQSCRSSAR